MFVYYTIVSGSYEYWSFIRADGQYGYVMSRYLHLIYEPVGRAPGFRGQVPRQGFIR